MTALEEQVRVLLFSNHPVLPGQIATMLNSQRYCIRVADMPIAFDDDPPDVILVDVNHSPLDGERWLASVRQHETTVDVPIVLVTGKEDLERWIPQLEQGVVDYVTTPFGAAELRARISLVLRTRAMFEEARERHLRLERMSITDALTGLYNSWYLMHRCSEEVARAKRHRYPVSCLMLDIDNFKQVNDTYGHPAGNAVLGEMGGLLKANTRTSDVVGRYGGEEFLLLLPQTNRGEALVLAERLRKVVEEHRFRVGRASIQLTVSVGAATFPDRGIVGHETLVRHADRAMYRAKLGGRNRVVAG